MGPGIDLKWEHGRAITSTEMDNPLDAFATENDLAIPAGATPARHVVLVRDPFVSDSVLARDPARPRGRAWLTLTVFVLMATAGWGAYMYELHRQIDFDAIATWASRLVPPPETTATAPATAPTETRTDDAVAVDPLPAPDASVTSSEPDRTPDARDASNTPASRVARPDASRSERTGTSGSAIAPVRTVSGEWRLDTQTEATDSSLQSQQTHYEITLKQDGDRVTGVGRKISGTEREPGPGADNSLTITGIIAGDRLTLNFIERGAQPATGKFVLLIGESGTLQGRFSTSEGQRSGHLQARRVASQRRHATVISPV